MRLSHDTSRRLSVVMFVATLLVVMCHVQNFLPFEQKTWWVRCIGTSFTMANVSNFFLLSGFYLSLHFRESNWWREALKKRITTLVVPYFAWCTLYLIIDILLGKQVNLIHVYGLGPTTFPIYLPLWYIKTLFFYVLISPILLWVFHKGKGMGVLLVILVLLFQISAALYGNQLLLGRLRFSVSLVGFAFFIIGAMFGFYGWKINVPKSRLVALSALVVWILGAMLYTELSKYWAEVFEFAIVGLSIIALHTIVQSIPNVSLPNWLVGTSFTIYLTHYVILPFTDKIFKEFPPVLLLVFSFSVTIMGCVLIGLLVNRISAIRKILTGGR